MKRPGDEHGAKNLNHETDTRVIAMRAHYSDFTTESDAIITNASVAVLIRRQKIETSTT